MSAARSLKGALHPHSLRFQLLSRSLMILAAILLLIGGLQYLLMQQFLYRNQAMTIQSQILTMPHDMWMPGGGGRMPRKDEVALPGRPMSNGTIAGVKLAFIDANGGFTVIKGDETSASDTEGDGGTTDRRETAAESIPRLAPQDYSDALDNKSEVDYRIVRGANGEKQMVVLQPVNARGRLQGVVQASIGTRFLDEVLFSQLLTFLGLAAIALLFGLVTYLPVLKRTLVPLNNIMRTVEQIDAGQLAQRLPTGQGQAEIDRLSYSFNGMLQRLETSFLAEQEAKEKMRRFVADASHELRTPLTSIHGFLEVLIRGAAQHPQQLDRALRSMLSESERINKLVADLLLLARLDRTPEVEWTEGLLDRTVMEMEPQLRLLAGERTLRLSITPEVKAVFDRDKIKQVLLNLFHNAVQHTDPEQGRIAVELTLERSGCVLHVSDNGAGIPEEQVPHVFDRFYRVDSARSRAQGGAGLGLSITKSIVDLHGGTIEVESVEGEGTSFRIHLPLHPPGAVADSGA
ncbi:sensor histidine kinase [Paenibacillus validus]|uniref:histidine kinase n=1 Tax=Paenibacillus validus TaxID=44253 RepID=A0A7X3CV08_9BACL|nr:HAMP domain-containing sensor histidine kinase [Paenibacillus validus]MUG74062.1 HAMP domain-containing protein [Paenibacillus validus]